MPVVAPTTQNMYVFSTQAHAQAVQAAVDAVVGPYPKAGGNVGGGIHVPPDQSETLTYALPVQNGAQWNYPADAVTTVALAHPTAVSALATAGVTLPSPTAVAVVPSVG
jgi:hypothetical protein